MENKKTRVSVFVAGQRFNILTEKTEKYVMDIASKIDAKINSLVLTQEMSRERAAVLTALDYADDSELDKESIAAVKEQIKEYLHEIERLQDSNAKCVSDYNLLKTEYERLIAERQSAEDAVRALNESQEKITALQQELKEKDALIAALQQSASEKTAEEKAPIPEEPPVKEEPVITAEDDLFFEPEEVAEQIRPEKKKKNRHEHHHVNPYQQKAKEKAQKGYQQQRQYSFFELNEE